MTAEKTAGENFPIPHLMKQLPIWVTIVQRFAAKNPLKNF